MNAEWDNAVNMNAEWDDAVNMNAEWDDDVNSMSYTESRKVSNDNICSLSDSLHIYVLANILRRPIVILTDNLSKLYSQHNSNNDDVEGVYLPLEWKPAECCTIPIIIGYSSQRYYPLISEAGRQNTSQQGQKDTPVFPLINGDMGLLLVRFLTEGESTKEWNLLQSYLLIKELKVRLDDGAVITAPCAQMKLKPLKSNLNLMFKYVNGAGILDSVYKYLHSTSRTAQNNSQTEKTTVKFVTDKTEQLENDIDKTLASTEIGEPKKYNSKIYGQQESDLLYHKDNIVQQLNPSEYGHNYVHPTSESAICSPGDLPLTPSAPPLSLEPESQVEVHSVMCRNQYANTCTNKTYPYGHECLEKESQGNNNVCSHFVKSVKSPIDGDMNVTSEMSPHGTVDDTVTSTASYPAKKPQLYQRMLSMMTERCITGCGYRCSNQTYPYCHECFQNENQRSQQQTQNDTIASAPPQSIEVIPAQPKFTDKCNDLVSQGKYESEVLDVEKPFKQLVSPLVISEKRHTTGHRSDVTCVLAEDKIENIVHKNWEDQRRTLDGQKTLYDHILDNQVKDISGAICHKASGESDISKSVATNVIGSVDIQKKRNTKHSSVMVANKNINSNTELSVKPKVKCVSPYCQTLISGPDELCSNCQDILKSSSGHKISTTQANVDVNHLYTGQELQTALSLYDSSHENISKENACELETYKPDPHIKLQSGLKTAARSFYGSYILQASEDIQSAISSCQHYDETSTEMMNEFSYSKSDDKKQHQAAQQEVNLQRSRDSVSLTSNTENSFHKDIQPNSSSQNITVPHQEYINPPFVSQVSPVINPPFVSQVSPVIKTTVLETTSSSSCQAYLDFPGSSLSMSTPVSEIHQPLPQNISNAQYSQTFKHRTAPSSPSGYSQQHSSRLSDDPDLKSVIATSMTKYNPYENRQLSTKLAYSFHPQTNPSTNIPYNVKVTDNSWKTSASKCRMSSCFNYGNIDKDGYCNECHKVISRQQDLYWEAMHGVDVPD